jgi:nicotinate-nucleotide adenylyltransferase
VTREGVGCGVDLGVLGGTFDPIHVGHLVAAEAVREAFGLPRVLFVPAGRPPHKGREVEADPEDRYLMACLATADHPAFDVSRVEIDRPGPSYTLDTLRELSSRSGDRLLFIAGADAICGLASWHGGLACLTWADFVAVSRPGHGRERIEAFVAGLPPDLRPRIHYLEIPPIGVSSHELRQRVRRGESIRYLVPDPVARFIAKRGLYRGGGAPPAGG